MRSSKSTRITITVRFVQSVRAAKVCDFNIAIEVAEYIFSFDISMNNARLVDVFEAKKDFPKSILAEIFTARLLSLF